MVDTENIHKISQMGNGSSLAVITDNADFPHTGLFKALNQMSSGNIVVKTGADFDINQTGGNIVVDAGKILRNGMYHSVNTKTFADTDLSTSHDKGYHLLVVADGRESGETVNNLYLRTPTAPNVVADFKLGDTIVAMIEYSSTTSAGGRLIQFFTTSKEENGLSIAYANSNVYTEVGSITGTSAGLFVSGIGTATVASDDKVLIQDTNASDVIKSVTAASIAALAPQGDITSVVAGSALTGGGTTGDVTLNVGVDDSTIEINSDALRLKDSGVTVGKMAANSVDSDQYVDGSVDNIHLATGIDAVKIADGTVTSEEFQRINTLTSNAQTQLDTKLQVGQFSMWIPAEAISPQSVNPCGSLTTTANANATQPDFRTLAFDAGTDEFAQFSIAMPKMWNEGTVLFTFYWTHAGSAGNDVIWTIAGTSVSNDEAIGGVIFGTAVNYQDTALTAKDLHIISSDTALTIAGSPAVGDVCFFQISRDANNGNDDFASDALLMGVKMTYTVDGLNDA